MYVRDLIGRSGLLLIFSAELRASRRWGRFRSLPGQECNQILELLGGQTLVIVGGHQALGFNVDAAQIGTVERMKPLIVADHLQGISILVQQDAIEYFSVSRGDMRG